MDHEALRPNSVEAECNKHYISLTRAVLGILLVLGMEVMNSIGHNVFWIHGFL